jgi:hypothetical protein
MEGQLRVSRGEGGDVKMLRLPFVSRPERKRVFKCKLLGKASSDGTHRGGEQSLDCGRADEGLQNGNRMRFSIMLVCVRRREDGDEPGCLASA